VSTVVVISWQKGERLLLAAGLVLLLGAAVVHGLWTDRWGSTRDLDQALARLDRIPSTLAGWTVRDVPVDADQAEGAARVGIARVVRKQFIRAGDGQSVSVILMGGRFGPLCVHTPDVCFGGAGYVMSSRQMRQEIVCENGSTVSFWTAEFKKPGAVEAAPLRIYWGWNASKGWQAPDNPRYAFRMQPVLFKLYLVREITPASTSLTDDPAVALLKTWLPALDEALFP
jgi:hypothetical protein